MKKLIFVLAFQLIAVMQMNAQWTGGTSTTGNTDRTGNVGIGISATSTDKLAIGGDVKFSGQTNYKVAGDISSGVFTVYPGGSSNNGPFIEMYGQNNTSEAGTLSFGAYGSSGRFDFVHYSPTNSSWKVLARITPEGKMVIGDVNYNTATTYGLYVADGIMTEQVKVAIKTTNDWSDFVFNKSYKLMPLKQLEKYIEMNKHLPDVPSATEVLENGVNMAKMDATLLQKIEELTLYTIELNKKILEMQAELAKFEKQK